MLLICPLPQHALSRLCHPDHPRNVVLSGVSTNPAHVSSSIIFLILKLILHNGFCILVWLFSFISHLLNAYFWERLELNVSSQIIRRPLCSTGHLYICKSLSASSIIGIVRQQLLKQLPNGQKWSDLGFSCVYKIVSLRCFRWVSREKVGLGGGW